MMSETLSRLQLNTISPHNWLLVDTNFLIDSSKAAEIYRPFIDTLKSQGAVFTTIELVQAEFLRGANSLTDYRELLNYFNYVITTVLPTDRETNKNAIERIASLYTSTPAKSAITDLYLAATLMKYDTRLTLLTANHKDFPITLFDRLHIQPVEDGNIIKVFAFYQFSSKKYQKTLEKLLSRSSQ